MSLTVLVFCFAVSISVGVTPNVVTEHQLIQSELQSQYRLVANPKWKMGFEPLRITWDMQDTQDIQSVPFDDLSVHLICSVHSGEPKRIYLYGQNTFIVNKNINETNNSNYTHVDIDWIPNLKTVGLMQRMMMHSSCIKCCVNVTAESLNFDIQNVQSDDFNVCVILNFHHDEIEIIRRESKISFLLSLSSCLSLSTSHLNMTFYLRSNVCLSIHFFWCKRGIYRNGPLFFMCINYIIYNSCSPSFTPEKFFLQQYMLPLCLIFTCGAETVI